MAFSRDAKADMSHRRSGILTKVGVSACASLTLVFLPSCTERKIEPVTFRDPSGIKPDTVLESPKAGQMAASEGSEPVTVQLPPIRDDAGEKSWLVGTELPLEYWEVHYINAVRFGFTHNRIERTGDQRLKLASSSTLQVQRGDQLMRMVSNVETIEQENGVVDSFFEVTQENDKRTSVSGNVSKLLDEREVMTLKSDKPTASLPFPRGTWGPLGVQQMLLRRPMQTGERRVARLFLPQIHQLAEVQLVAGSPEDTTSPLGLIRSVVPIDVEMQLDKQNLRSRIWADSKGQILKSVMTQGMNISYFRVSRQEAQRVESQGKVDILANTAVPLDRPLPELDTVEKIVYVLEAQGQDPFSLLSRQSNQSVRSESAFRSRLTVWRPKVTGPPLSGENGPEQNPPGPECLKASAMIQSDDPVVEQLAVSMAADEKRPVELTLKLTSEVFRGIRKKNYLRAFDSAAEVAKSLEGDCTEHAVLLAALLRNRGIPARIASGLIANSTPTGSTLIYHMWTEAWIGDRWLPVDATLGSIVRCGHIKFLETALSEENPYIALLTVMNAVGKIKVSILDSN